MKVVAFGDSNTFGQGLKQEQAWPAILGELLDCEVLNYGKCGDTTRSALERIGKVQREEADWWVVQFGMNDCNRWETDRGVKRVSQLSFLGNLTEIYHRATVFGAPAEQVVLCTITNNTRSDQLAHDSRLYSHIVRKVAREHKTRLFDAERLGPWTLSDHVHLDEEAHRKFARGVWDTIAC